MATWKEYIEKLKKKWLGKKVMYDGCQYTIVDVDYNGILHIDRQTKFNKTTAAFNAYDVVKALVD